MPVYRLPIFYKHYAIAEIEAESLEAAIERIDLRDFTNDNIDEDSMQVPDSEWEVDMEGLDEMDPEIDGDCFREKKDDD